MLVALAHNFPRRLPEIHLKLMWYAAFGITLNGLTLKGEKSPVEAPFLEWLLTNPMAARLIYHTGIHVHNITLTDNLTLDNANIGFPVDIVDSELRGITLTDATTRSINLEGCKCDYVRAARIQIDGRLRLAGSTHTCFRADGPVDLTCAQISGDLECSGGHFKSSGNRDAPWALKTDLANVHGSVLLADTTEKRCFHADGQIYALEMTVGGNFDCTSAEICNPAGHAISLDRSTIGGSVFLRNGFSATGEVRLIGTRITGDLDCSGGTFSNDKDGTRPRRVALEARNIHIDNCVYIGGSLNKSDDFGAGIVSFHTDGLISFDGAHIGHDLFIGKHDDNKDELMNKGGYKGTITHLNTENRINIRNAHVGGSMRFMADFGGVTLCLNNTTTDKLFVPNEQTFWPTYSRRRFSYNFIHFLNVEDDSACTDIEYLDWLSREDPPNCPFDPHIHEQLAAALSRSGEETAAKTILIDKEDRRRGLKPSLQARSASCRWGADDGSKPPQTIKNGRDAVGRRWGNAVWSSLLKRSMCYGYKPGRLLLWSVAIVAIGWLVFSLGDGAGLIVPVEKIRTETVNNALRENPHCAYSANQWKEALQDDPKNNILPIYYPAFNPFIYSLEVFLPVVTFNQQAYWQPDDMGCSNPSLEIAQVPGAGGTERVWSRRINVGHVLGDIVRWWSWFEAGAGWLCVTLVAVALTGLIPKISGKT